MQKALQLGVPKGPLCGKLKNGSSITLNNGKVIEPSQCVEPSTKGGVILVIDVPSMEYLSSFQNHPSENSKNFLTILQFFNFWRESHPIQKKKKKRCWIHSSKNGNQISLQFFTYLQHQFFYKLNIKNFFLKNFVQIPVFNTSS